MEIIIRAYTVVVVCTSMNYDITSQIVINPLYSVIQIMTSGMQYWDSA